MPLTRCPDCDAEVSDVAPACPNCGRPAGAPTAAAAPTEGIAARDRPINHARHLLLSVITLGWWLPIYGLTWASSRWGCRRVAGATVASVALFVGVPMTIGYVHYRSMTPEERAAFDAEQENKRAELQAKREADKARREAERAKLQAAREADRARREAEEAERECTEQSATAFLMSRDHVRRRLRAPRSAKFPWTDFTARPIGNCTYEVRSYVDAQNGFGAMLRTHYVARMRVSSGDQWSLVDLKLLE